jgi:hypothetical protein
VNPGATAFARIPSGASFVAHSKVAACSTALLPPYAPGPRSAK